MQIFAVYLGGTVGTGGTTPGPSAGGYRYDGYAITPTNSKLECIRTNYAPVDGSNNKKMTQKLPFYSMDAYRYIDSSGIAHMYSTPLPELPTGWSRSFGYTSNYGSFIVKRDSGVTYPKRIYAVDPDGGAGGETTVANNSLELDIDTMFHELTHQNRGPDENTAYWYGNKGLQNYQNASVNSVCK
ncbi:MAG: hypothetical protein QM741_07980 [Rudaea sp.]|uniref:hypothetical protein n=1 Tax=Rudaea sp. TaxID=2136325 RepID=UPI0039E45598